MRRHTVLQTLACAVAAAAIFTAQPVLASRASPTSCSSLSTMLAMGTRAPMVAPSRAGRQRTVARV